MYYAHSVAVQPKDTWQSLHEHLNGVAALAGRFGVPFGAERAASLAGLLHDLGKYTSAFQARLDGGKSVDHATAGAREVLALATGSWDKVTAELIAYAIAGHHAGLPDKLGGDASLADRLKKPIEPIDLIWREEIAPDAHGLWPSLKLKVDSDQDRAKANAAFQIGFLGRMIFSCLIDADRRDTEAFYANTEGWKPDRDWPALRGILDCRGETRGWRQIRAEAIMNNRRRRRMLSALATPLRIVFKGVRLDLAPGRLVTVPSPIPPEQLRAQLAEPYSIQLRCPAEAKRLAELFERGELQAYVDRMARQPDGGSA